MIIGSLAALYQKRIKRLMAYSGIANVGYMLIGLASGTIESMTGLLIFLIIYIAMTIAFFSFVLGFFSLFGFSQFVGLYLFLVFRRF